MARETDIITADGLTLYQTIRRSSDGEYYNGASFEVFNAGHWTSYATALNKTVLSSGLLADYAANFPTLAAGQYQVEIYRQAGGSPALGDGPPRWVSIIAWNGAAEVTVQNVITSNPAIVRNVSIAS
jgi:hypothetical protein